MQDVGRVLRMAPIHVINPRSDKEEAILAGEEFESLISTLGGKIVDRLIQKLDRPNNATYIGKGKVAELAEIVKEKQIDVIVLNAMVKPGQIYTLEKTLKVINPQIQVWDRIDLILHIFDQHASTIEAKLQIELARMRYMGPRIYGMGFVLSRQGGGIGTSGIGETNTELMRRHWRNEIKKVTERLEKINKNRQHQIEKRKSEGFKTVSIVGYTNAGKSSLFNTLTKKDALVENKLFVTLDSSIGEIYIPKLQSEILVSDTIGFIRDLPTLLISAFKSTLMESVHSDIILHIVDASDKEIDTKINVVNNILKEIGRNASDSIYVFNKIDLIPSEDKQYLMDKYIGVSPVFISAKNGEGIANVIEAITNRI